MENEFNYMGMEPYAAVLFAAEDRERALPWMERLVTEGYRVWSAAGSDDEAMSEETAARIKDAELLFWIITAGTARSHLFRSMMDHAVLIGKKTYAYLDGSPDFMPLSMKLEMTVLSCELVGEPGNAQSSLDAVCGIPELRRCRSGPSPASKRPSDRQQENGPHEDVRTDGQYGPYGQEDILPDDMTGTTARTEAAFPDEQNDRTEKIGEVPKPVLLFRLRDRSCLCFRLRVIRLGRSRKRCDVCLEDNAKISGYHADLQLKNGSVYLRDVGSTNGTFLNGVRLKEDVPEKLPEHAFFRLFDESFQVVYGPDAERICSDGFVLMLQNAVTLEKRYVTEPELLLDRKHPWEGGTLNDILISREHAKIVFVGKQPCVIDLLSHNGTWLDGRKLESGQPTALLDGMRLRLGDTELICSLVEVSESGGPEPAQSGAGTPD